VLIDVHPWGFWSYPLRVFGANAILAYVAPILMKTLILQQWHMADNLTLDRWGMGILTHRFGPVTGGWYYTGIFMLAWWLVLWRLYQKKIFIRL
jgi:predicted acyltransferase